MSESFKGLLRKIQAGTATAEDHQRDHEAFMAEVQEAIGKGRSALSKRPAATRSAALPNPYVHIGRLIAQQERDRMSREDHQ